MATIPYKYRLLEFMRKLPHKHYHKVKRELPRKLGVAQETFTQWMYIKSNSGRMIYAEYLYALAQYFDVEVKDMFTEEPAKIEIESINEPNLFDDVESRV